MKTAYGIGDPDACCEDWLLGICCTCCVANQMLQTAKARGRAVVNGGRELNVTKPVIAEPIACCSGECCCLFWCLPCKVGSMLQDSMGMPWCTGCCCMSIYGASNLVRYQYRQVVAKGVDEEMEEVVKPYLFYVAAYILGGIWGPLGCLVLPPYLAWMTSFAMTVQNTVNAHSGQSSKGYLVGFTPDPISTPTQSEIPMTVGTVVGSTGGVEMVQVQPGYVAVKNE